MADSVVLSFARNYTFPTLILPSKANTFIFPISWPYIMFETSINQPIMVTKIFQAVISHIQLYTPFSLLMYKNGLKWYWR